ncbi:DUF2142 domain-containing protein [Dactylosporangium sp. CS-033363]|uniref:DUF2142 domain-containing protein n=1 Tax=Dactylosporangium sp. CS-033363 TaxID=3239935 RepID=UPI003D94D4C4
MSPLEPPRRRFWEYLTAFFLVIAGWALAMPANGTYDEKDHIVRAYAVVTGQWTPAHTVVDRRDDTKPAFLVPATLLPPNSNVDCAWSPRPARSAACQRWVADPERRLTPSGAARYSPVYYLIVGAPLAVAPNLTGIVLARLLSALAAAALLAGALNAARRLRGRLLPLAVVLTATPTAANLAGSINPNGLEIAAGAAACCALLALLRLPCEELDAVAVRRLLWLLGTASFVLLTVRQLGPLLLLLVLAACAALARKGRLSTLARRRPVWALLGSWLAGLAVSVSWMAYSRIADVATVARDARHFSLSVLLRELLAHRLPFYVNQFVAQFGYGETRAPAFVIVIWYLLLAVVVAGCLTRAPRRTVLVCAGLGVACLGLLVALEVHYLPLVGWFAQGRYAMPAAVGVVLCAASEPAFGQFLSARRRLRVFCATSATVAAALHLYALAFVMTRFQGSLDPFNAAWHPWAGSLLPLVSAACGLTLLTVLVTGMAPARIVLFRSIVVLRRAA